MGSEVTITPDITPDAGAPVTITPDAPAAPQEKPSLWQRFREGIGLPSLDDIKAMNEHAKQSKSFGDTVKEAVTTAAPAYGIVKNYAKTAGKGIKEGAGEMVQAANNVAAGGPVGANAGKAAYGAAHAIYQSIPIIGGAAENVGNDVADNNYAGAAGGAAGVMAQAALPEVLERGVGAVSNVKGKLFIPKEVKAAAAEAPDAATVATASRTAPEIKQAAAGDLNNTLHSELDGAAKEFNVDVADTNSARVKAHRVGDSLQQKAQELYQQADAIAQKVTGHPGRFQQFTEDIKGLREQIRGTYDPTVKANLEQQLGEAQKQYGAYQQAMEAAGVPLNVVKQADKHWSIGTSYKEVGNKIGTAEALDGSLTPTARPLDKPIRSISREGEKRGHVLANAMGEDRAARITQAVQDAGDRVAADMQSTRAAKQSIKATNERVATAQKRIADVKANRGKVAKGALAVLGAGAAYSAGNAAVNALSKRKED